MVFDRFFGPGEESSGSDSEHEPVDGASDGEISSTGSDDQLGESANSTKSHARQYNNLRKSDTGRMRDKAKADAKQVTRKTSTKAKQGLRNTKEKVSRW
ncbi:hypothetical protein EL22_28280 [Halostagnicola sp. A56]|uniref:hypothetical protein n=1 Tax=Halostagnicola sp. A56 TaxID=1495067 RepID=UPI00065F69CB|nr:hypothetical protein [Halostagnicola sp. A56]KMT45658.1 hypothetical protein EL22_28280 [Halostagnicola sp. A56]